MAIGQGDKSYNVIITDIFGGGEDLLWIKIGGKI